MTAGLTGVVPWSVAELARARAYLYGGIAAGVAAQLWLLALLALAHRSGAAARLAAGLRRQFRSRSLTNAIIAALVLAYGLVGLLPFSFWLGWVRERQFGFARLGAGAWLGQWAESALLTILVGAAVIVIAYGWVRARHDRRAWLRMWAVVTVAAVLAVAADPILIQPLFHRFTPVRDPAVRAEIAKLARRAGIPHAAIYEVDASRQSSHTNAYVEGIFGSERIVVYDTLLRRQSLPEIAFVVGHEIGHYVLHHLWKGLGFTAVYLLGLFALLGWLFPRWSRGRLLGDIGALPLVLLILLAAYYLSAPLPNGFSRWEEHQADAYGLQLSGQACAAVSSFRQEVATDLIYPAPNRFLVWWFFNHPSQQQRIAFAAGHCRTARRP